MNKDNALTILSVSFFLIIAAVLITSAALTLLNETEPPEVQPNITVPEIITVDISDGTIQINIAGDKYKNLCSFSVITDMGDLTDIKYDGSASIIPFREGTSSIKIVGHFLNKADEEIFYGEVKHGIVAVPINPKDVKFTVTFISDGVISTKTVCLNDKISRPAEPEKSGYEFAGWFADESLTKPYDFNSFVMTDLTLRAKWSKIHEVRFDSNGGLPSLRTQYVSHGGFAKEPLSPLKVGDSFAGWYSDCGFNNLWNFSEAVTEDMTLFARWDYENGDYPLGDYAYKNQYDSLKRVVSLINGWYEDDVLVLRNFKAVSFDGNNLLSLPQIPGRKPVMFKTSAAMTLALNSAASFYSGVSSGSQIYIVEGGKVVLNGGGLVFVVERADFNPDEVLIEIDDGGELLTDEDSRVVVRVVNGC